MGTPVKLSIITPTNRPDSLALVDIALQRQTSKDFEWITIAPKGYDYGSIKPDITLDDPVKNVGDYWSLFKAYNKAIEAANGEYILSVQDFTFFDSDTVKKLLFNMKPYRLITGVGHKYEKVYPEKGPIIWTDPRVDGSNDLKECPASWIEFNLGCFPKQAVYDIGGFDEYLDAFAGMCGLDVVDRLKIKGGYEFMIDQSMHSYSTDHGRPPQWEERGSIHGPYFKRKEEYYINPVLDYLN